MDTGTSDKRKTVTSIIPYKWVALLLIVVVAAVVFSPSILPWLLSGTGNAQETAPIVTSTPLPVHPTDIEFRVDTPPFYTLGHQAALKMASLLDASVQPGSNGIVFHCSYISSHSYFDQCKSFIIPAVAPLPPIPQPSKFTANAFTDAKLRSDYHKAILSWKDAVKAAQIQLAAIRNQVRQETDELRATKFFYDDKGSDPMSSIALASDHLRNVSGQRVLIIASTMTQNLPLRNAGTITLQGVDVKLIYVQCILPTAAACQANLAYWDHFFNKAGSKSFQAFDAEQSDALQTLI